jgi:CheY-like chemotaxis protein
MGGELSVESEFGKGTVFRVRIRQGLTDHTPIGKETAENLRAFRYEKKRKQAKLIRPDLSYARVLVVDDFAVNLVVAAGMLRKYKMTVDCTDNGRDSVDRIAAGTPVYNAVFMDHMMPGMDGVEATRLIRAIDTKYAKNIPIIALTANAVVGSKQMFLDSGFNAFLPKPFNAMILDSVIQQWVGTGEQEKNTVEHGMTEKTEKIVFEGEILICEDNIMNQDLICERLVRAGLKTVAAENGKEGVEMVLSRMQSNTKPFDMIFMDIFMPVMDGLEAATEITKLNTGTPIVAMTSNITSADREKYSAHGMSDSLSKPFTSKELSDCLMKHLKPLSPVGRNVADISFQIEKKFIQDDDLRFEEDLKNKFIRIFVNNNKTKYDEIAKAVNDRDIKTAHRLAHSLKGNAGMIGKTRLQKAAEDVEMLLNEENLDLASVAKHPAMGVLKAELEAVINNEQ